MNWIFVKNDNITTEKGGISIKNFSQSKRKIQREDLSYSCDISDTSSLDSPVNINKSGPSSLYTKA